MDIFTSVEGAGGLEPPVTAEMVLQLTQIVREEQEARRDLKQQLQQEQEARRELEQRLQQHRVKVEARLADLEAQPQRGRTAGRPTKANTAEKAAPPAEPVDAAAHNNKEGQGTAGGEPEAGNEAGAPQKAKAKEESAALDQLEASLDRQQLALVEEDVPVESQRRLRWALNGLMIASVATMGVWAATLDPLARAVTNALFPMAALTVCAQPFLFVHAPRAALRPALHGCFWWFFCLGVAVLAAGLQGDLIYATCAVRVLVPEVEDSVCYPAEGVFWGLGFCTVFAPLLTWILRELYLRVRSRCAGSREAMAALYLAHYSKSLGFLALLGVQSVVAAAKDRGARGAAVVWAGYTLGLAIALLFLLGVLLVDLRGVSPQRLMRGSFSWLEELCMAASLYILVLGVLGYFVTEAMDARMPPEQAERVSGGLLLLWIPGVSLFFGTLALFLRKSQDEAIKLRASLPEIRRLSRQGASRDLHGKPQ